MDLEHRFENIESEISLEQFYGLTYKFCGNDEVARLVNCQISQSKKKPKGRRYSLEFKLECLALYFTGPRTYRQVLVKKYCLPSPTTLLRILQHVQINSGLNNPQVFAMLKMKADCFDDKSKYCVLCIDEMSIKAHLFYNRGTDAVVGLSEIEDTNNILRPALNVSVLMLRGIFSKWKQPVAFSFCHSSCPADILKQQIIEAITKLGEIGLKICAVTTDMGSNYMPLSNLLGVTANRPYFYCRGQKIYYIFDIPHIFKAIRNMLIKYDFLIDNHKISWSFIKSFYEHDKKYAVRAAPKLTTSHISPSSFEKMKAKYALQVFSATVSSGMNVYIRFGQLPPESYHTSEFVSKMDKLFDMLNSSSTSSAKLYNRAYKNLPHQVELLNECTALFNKIKIINEQNKNVTNRIKSFKCIRISINSIRSLWNDFNEKKINYLLTRRLNSDCLENFFGSVRQQNGNCRNPTPIQFKRTFKKLVYLKIFHSGTENCEADPDSILLKLADVPDVHAVPSTKNMPIEITTQLIGTDYQQDEMLHKNFVRYICGYLLKKALNIHSCDVCITFSNHRQELDDSSLYIYFRAYENSEKTIFGNLKNPADIFVDFIANVEEIFQTNFHCLIARTNICNNLFQLVHRQYLAHPCGKFPKEFVLKLYLRIRLYYTLKHINNNFKDQKNIRNKLIIWRNQ